MKTAIKTLIRPHYLEMDGYVSAGMEASKDSEKIFLNANESPYPLPGLEGFNRYPEPQNPALREAYARAYNVESDWVIMTRGADEAIVILTKIFCEPHKDNIVICPPTFGMYKVDANSMPAEAIEVPLIKEQGTFALDKDGVIAAGKNENVKLVFLCSPNNPTGTSLSHETISEIAEELEGHAMIILDETYAEFAETGSMCADLDSTPNLIILRTLSKSYAFAGMRMGCFICADTDFTDLVRSKGLDAYPLPQASIEAAFHVLSPEIAAIAEENRKTLLKNRDELKAALEQSTQVTHIYPSDANFLLIEMKNAQGFYDFAFENNIILRDFSNKSGTEDCLRISIGTEEQNAKLLELLNMFDVNHAT